MSSGGAAVPFARVSTLKTRLAEWLESGDIVRFLPEVDDLRGVQQAPEYHPEGDAYQHTLLAVASVDDSDDPRLFWAVLLHDIGKRETTVFVNGRWRSHGHAAAGAKRVAAIMARLGYEELSDDVAWLVKNHHYHHSWQVASGTSLTKRQQRFTQHPLFSLLQKVCRADALGKQKPVSRAVR